MNISQIRLQSTPMKIGLNIEHPVQKIEQPKAIQSIEQPKADIKMERMPARLTIDQTRLWAELGFKSTNQLVDDFANESFQAGLEGIARRIQQGEELMRIENKGNPLATQMKKSNELPQFVIAFLPSGDSVDISYTPGEVKIDVTPQKPRINVESQKPNHEYMPGKVSTYIEQRNSLQIDFVNLFDQSV